MQFKDSIALVTGAARGIGWETARQFHKSGCKVILVDLNEEDLKSAIKRIDPAETDRLIGLPCDVSDAESVTALFSKIKEICGGLDILVNNAGITRDNLFMRMKMEQWQQVIDVNLTGTYLCTRAAASLLRKSNRGRIITISSVAAAGNAGQANYSASKAGLIGLTKTLALELARYGITANCVSPGFIETEMTEAIPEKAKNVWLEKIPATRSGQPDDIAKAILFLASESADYITGQVLGVDGGLSI
jgi:3-oxoacyl-[acyl-carrier protein] reductase